MRAVDAGLDQLLRDRRLMVAEANDQKRLIRIIALQFRDKLAIVACGHGLAADVFIDFGGVARRLPVGRQLRLVDIPPWEMISGEIEEHEDGRAPGNVARKYL